MRRERGELPSTSSSLSNHPQRSKHEAARHPRLVLVPMDRDVPMDDRLGEEDVCDFLHSNSIKVIDISICIRPPSIFLVLASLNDFFRAMDCLQGKSLPRFPKVRFNANPHNFTVATFDLGTMVLHGLPLLMNNRDDPLQLVERFITQTEPRAEFVKNLLPSGIVFLRKNHAGMCFAYFRNSADAEEAIRVLDNKPFDPTSKVSGENRTVRAEMAKSTQQHQDDRNANEGRFGTRDGRTQIHSSNSREQQRYDDDHSRDNSRTDRRRENNAVIGTHRDPGAAVLHVTALDKNWNDRVDETDLTDLFEAARRSSSYSGPMPETDLKSHFAHFIFPSLDTAVRALEVLQGVPLLPRFPDIYLKVSIETASRLKFGLSEVAIRYIPADCRASEIEHFLTQSTAEGRRTAGFGFIPFSVTFAYSKRYNNNYGVDNDPKKSVAFAMFYTREGAEDAIQTLNGKSLDPNAENDRSRSNHSLSLERTRSDVNFAPNSVNNNTNKSNFNDDDYAADRNRRHMSAEHHNEQQQEQRAYSYSEDADRRRADPRYQDDDRSQYHRSSAVSSLPDPRRSSSSTDMFSDMDDRRQQYTTSSNTNTLQHNRYRGDGRLDYAAMVGIIQRQLLPQHIDQKTQDQLEQEILTFLGETLRRKCFQMSFRQGACFMMFKNLTDTCNAVAACQYQPSTFCRGGLYKASLTNQTKDAFGIVSVRIRNLPLSFESISRTNKFVQDQLGDGSRNLIPELTYMFESIVPWRDKTNDPEHRQMFLAFTSEAAAKHCCDVIDGYKFSDSGEILGADIFTFEKR